MVLRKRKKIGFLHSNFERIHYSYLPCSLSHLAPSLVFSKVLLLVFSSFVINKYTYLFSLSVFILMNLLGFMVLSTYARYDLLKLQWHFCYFCCICCCCCFYNKYIFSLREFIVYGIFFYFSQQ